MKLIQIYKQLIALLYWSISSLKNHTTALRLFYQKRAYPNFAILVSKSRALWWIDTEKRPLLVGLFEDLVNFRDDIKNTGGQQWMNLETNFREFL